MKPKQTFESLMDEFQYHFDLTVVFDDFLTIGVVLCGRDSHTGRPVDEALYLQAMEKYKDHALRFYFHKMLATLTLQMNERVQSMEGSDVLGEYYESRLARGKASPVFYPYPDTRIMARSAIGEAEKVYGLRRFQMVDPSCGSGRLLVVMADESRRKHQYFGIDNDPICVKMTALNLFLSGVVNAEVMCANASVPHDFRGSYKISLYPFGIFREDVKEKSQLWRLTNGRAIPVAFSKVNQN